MKLKIFKKGHNKIAAGLMLISLMSAGCTTPKNVSYFQDVTTETVNTISPQDIKIQPNDKLHILVKTMDPQLTTMFNLIIANDRMEEGINMQPGTSSLQQQGNAGTSGFSRYTVNPEGYIDFPVLGEIKVAGMNRSELAGFIKGEIMGRKLAKDPVVTVEFVNMGVSIMGEVVRPGRYDINQDRITLLEAISMAGDLTISGKREDITVLREIDGEQHTYKLDITNFKELSQSPAYYLKQGDIIYVEPNDMRKRQTTTNGNNVYSTGFWISVASLLTSVVTTLAVFIR